MYMSHVIHRGKNRLQIKLEKCVLSGALLYFAASLFMIPTESIGGTGVRIARWFRCRVRVASTYIKRGNIPNAKYPCFSFLSFCCRDKNNAPAARRDRNPTPCFVSLKIHDDVADEISLR